MKPRTDEQRMLSASHSQNVKRPEDQEQDFVLDWVIPIVFGAIFVLLVLSAAAFLLWRT